jgi:hypothetical protein
MASPRRQNAIKEFTCWSARWRLSRELISIEAKLSIILTIIRFLTLAIKVAAAIGGRAALGIVFLILDGRIHRVAITEPHTGGTFCV